MHMQHDTFLERNFKALFENFQNFEEENFSYFVNLIDSRKQKILKNYIYDFEPVKIGAK